MKTFRTNSRLNKLIKSENINAINKTSNNLFDVDFLQLPLSYKNIVFNKYLETKGVSKPPIKNNYHENSKRFI